MGIGLWSLRQDWRPEEAWSGASGHKSANVGLQKACTAGFLQVIVGTRLATILCFWVAVFGGVSFAAWHYFGRVQEELAAAQAAERRVLLEVERAQAKVDEQTATLERLRNDPVFIERTIRQRLNYVRPGEVVFRFRED